jgi:hypothetical protein
MNPLYISSYCTINKRGISSSAIQNLPSFSGNLDALLLDIYKTLGISYPKFFKMDTLCKLGFLASEITLNPILGKNKFESQDIGLILSNSSASLDTDLKYLDTISDPDNYFPSPGVFVYTLPNIVIGEICIRNKFMGENAFFVSEKFDAPLLEMYTETMITGNFAKACLIGWVEVLGEDFEAAFYFVEKAQPNSDRIPNFELNWTNLNNIYRI